jgi:predicted NUDIX family phosphoesterase
MEKIMVVPRKKLFGEDSRSWFQGFRPAEDVVFEEVILEHYSFKERGSVEEDESLKQIIPYIVFRFQDKFFVYKRLKRGGEKRLHNLYSIGIGGHINPIDCVKNNIITDAMRREFEEEVDYTHKYSFRVIGYINDDSNPVGRVHFGIVFLVEGESPGIEVKEKEKLEGKLMERSEIEVVKTSFEGWSKIVWEWLGRQ